MNYYVSPSSFIKKDSILVEEFADQVFLTQEDKVIGMKDVRETVISMDLVQIVQLDKILRDILRKAKKNGLLNV